MGARQLVVVAGATGYLGSHVARGLKAKGHRVRALVRDRKRLGPAGEVFDDVFEGQATQPDTLVGVCDEADAVFTSIGLRQVGRRPTFWQVDRDANLALVDEAERAGVKRFVYTSVFGAPERRRTNPLFEAKEQVADRLAESNMLTTVLRPTGLFNDMQEFFGMAKSGRMWVFGDGSAEVNPIHGADIGDVVAELLEQDAPSPKIDLGGPDTFTMREIGELAFDVLEKPPRFGALPIGLLSVASSVLKPFNANLAAILAGFHYVNVEGAVAPARGHRQLRDFFGELAAKA